MLLEARRLEKSYGTRKVVDDVNFSVDDGEIVGLLGPNGAGKTTSFRMTIGMINPDGGSVHFLGRDVTRLPMYKRARRGMGYLSQEPSVFQRLTVEDNLMAICETLRLTRHARRQKVEELLDLFGIAHVRKNLARNVSGGRTSPATSPVASGENSRSLVPS